MKIILFLLFVLSTPTLYASKPDDTLPMDTNFPSAQRIIDDMNMDILAGIVPGEIIQGDTLDTYNAPDTMPIDTPKHTPKEDIEN